MNEYEIQDEQGWTWDTLAGMALEFLQTDGPAREAWLAHVRAVAAEEKAYAVESGWE